MPVKPRAGAPTALSRAALTLLFDAERDALIDVAARARVVLRRGMTLVLPPGYAYRCASAHGCTRIELHAPHELLWRLRGASAFLGADRMATATGGAA